VGCRVIKIFRLLFVCLIPISALFEVGFVWALADVALALMTLVNLVGIFGLSKEVIQESNSYFLEENETAA
nr:alanine:cation symporter family protein [Chlamydiota bacterium]